MGVDPDDDAAAKVIAQRLSPQKQAWFDNLALRGAHEYAVELEDKNAELERENTALREQLAEARKQRDGWERARRDDEYTFERVANSIGMSWCCMAETMELESRIQQMVAKCSDLQSQLAALQAEKTEWLNRDL